jgi:Ca2+-binding RTX toxin-like protein
MGIASTDTIETTNPGINYTSPDETWVIEPGILVSSRDNDGVRSSQSGSKLINNGNIHSGSAWGVLFTGNNSAITNNSGRNIAGLTDGIFLIGDHATVTNHGTVIGYLSDGIVFDSGSNHIVLNNDGEIYGPAGGVIADSNNEGGTIHNSGLIRSDHFGVEVNIGVGLATIIDNAAGGTIKGTDAAITTIVGHISLNNRGTLIGQIDCNSPNENDLVINHGRISGAVHLGPGNDSFNGAGGTSGNVFGEAGNDTLKGGAHKDVLTGGLGRDTLRGAAAGDKFMFNAVLESVKGVNHDSILDFSHTQHDKIDLHVIDANTVLGGNQAFHFIGSHAFGHHKGELRYAGHLLQGDTNGNGVADIEVHVNAAHLVAGDFIL